jgi:V8-like Glu-specific endopeptidase
VANILIDYGTSFCTGTMLNNVRQDGKQYLLTAAHCIKSDPSFFIVGFNYQQARCHKGVPEKGGVPPRIMSAHGVSLVSKWDHSDMALLEISERIPDEYNVYMAGWDAGFKSFQDGFTIHHPQGDVKKISTFKGTAQLSSIMTYDQTKTFWRIPRWTEGSTEHGSSGAALFNSEGRVVGQLWGGTTSCERLEGWDMFGAFFADYSIAPPWLRLSNFLDADGSGTTVLNGAYLKELNRRKDPGVRSSEARKTKMHTEAMEWLLHSGSSATGYNIAEGSAARNTPGQRIQSSYGNPAAHLQTRPPFARNPSSAFSAGNTLQSVYGAAIASMNARRSSLHNVISSASIPKTA